MIGAAAIAAVSAAILAYEVLLVRLFAIVQWHHFAFMAISIALLGFGASGTLLALARPWLLPRAAGAFAACAALFGLAAPPAFLLAQRLPFNPLEIVWNPGQLLYLGAVYLLLAVPFTAGAASVGLAFVARPDAIARVYLWNLLGSGAGALAMVGALALLPPLACLAAVAGLSLAAAALAAERPRRLVAVAAAAALGAAAWAAAPPALRLSDYKPLAQALRAEGARLAAERSGPLALVSAVESPLVPFRHAPGLSLLAPALPGEQIGIFTDGDGPDVIERAGGDTAYLGWSTDALAYALADRPRVLALGAGGGRAVAQALALGARHVDAVELDRNVVAMVREEFAGFAGHLYARPEVTLHLAEPRSFLAGAAAAWEVIRLPDVGVTGAAAGGRGLSESYLLTVEGLELALRRLAPGGWLSVSGPVDLPPRATLKLAATVLAALERAGSGRPADSLVLVRGLTAFTLAVKRGPVTLGDVAALRAFAESRAFDLGYHPGMARAAANRFNLTAEPELFDGIAALVGPERDAFLAAYKFDIAPATDDRPYFHAFFRWRTAPELVALRGLGGAAMLEWGEIVVAATLLQALALAALLILLPLALARRPAGAWRSAGYFVALGLAFLFVEIAYIQKLTLFLGNPLYSVAVALAGFLAFAGLGAGASAALDRRLAPRFPPIGAAVAGIAALALGYLVALPAIFPALAHLGDAGRIAVALTLIAPLAFCMGMPFPLGLARVAARSPELVPWAWGLNGAASVVSAAAATLLAMHLGFAATVAIAVALYVLAAVALSPPA